MTAQFLENGIQHHSETCDCDACEERRYEKERPMVSLARALAIVARAEGYDIETTVSILQGAWAKEAGR